MSQLQQMASNLNGTTGSDYLVGTAGNDLIDGKGGNDYEIGNGGDDTFVYNEGYGALEIDPKTGYDTLEMGPGFTAANTYVFESHSHQGNDLILTDVTYGSFIRLDGAYDFGANAPNTGVVKFSDGTSLTFDQLNSRVKGIYDYDHETAVSNSTCNTLPILT